MLILAGVSINLVIGQNGIIRKAVDAKEKTEQAKVNEQTGMDSLYDEMLDAIGEEVPLGKVAVNEKASKNSTINGAKATAYNPIIPEGYIPINAGEANWGDGTSTPTEDNVNKGLVITDATTNGNEWVWVPVPTPSDLYVTAEEPIAITGGSGKTVVSGVTTSKYTAPNIIDGKTRVKPNDTSSYREPDIVVGSGTSYDADTTNEYYKIIGYSSTTEMAKGLVQEYSDMIDSLEKYQGFYIGRYELSNAGVKKDQPTLTDANWYNLYAKCKELKASDNDKVETRMIWGLQWDATCKWIASIKDEDGNSKYSITDSSSWGNYSNSTGNAAVMKEDGTTKAYGSKQNTGYSEYWKANNIYDLAGNCYEWTQEANGTGSRVHRGGSYYYGGSGFPASNRSVSYPDNRLSYRRFSSHFNSATMRIEEVTKTKKT